VGEAAPTAPATTLAVGDVVAERYRIDALLGQGGMGVVYRAEHLHLRKPLALKVLLSEWSSIPEVVARFEREAVAASNIQSPHVAAATDFGRLPNGSFFLVMEYVSGCTLRSVLEGGALAPARALHILRGIVSGLHAAHSLGIVHRDMKPENVMLIERDGDPDFVKLLDFGIAKVAGFGGAGPGGTSNPLTQVGAVIGTPDYMAPEQGLGESTDVRTDLYSVGVMLFEMLAGQRPFQGEAVTVIMKHVSAEVPELPVAVADGAGEGVSAILRRLLQKKVGDRFPSAADLLAAIDGCQRQGLPGRSPGSSPDLTATLARRAGKSIVMGLKASEIAARQAFHDPVGAVRHPTRVQLAIAAAVVTVAAIALVALTRAGTTDTPAVAPTPSAGSAQAMAPSVAPAPAPPPQPPAASAESVASATLPPPPPPSASSRSAAATPPSAQPHRAATPPKPRRTGPGGIYIPPPSQWFK
jgi:serine/threonine-protein kinase